MENFRQKSIVSLLLLGIIALFVTKCTDSRKYEKITDDTIRLNHNRFKHDIASQDGIEKINKKTLYLKQESKCQDELHHVTKQRDDAVQESLLLKDKYNELEGQLNALKISIKNEDDLLNDTKSQLFKYKELQKDYNKTKTKLAEDDKLILSLKSKKSDLEKEIIRLKSLKDSSSSEQEALTKEINSLNLKIEDLTKKVAKKESIIKELEAKNSDLNNSLSNEDNSCKKSLLSTKEKIAASAAALIAAKELSAKQDTKLKEKDRVIEELKQKYNDLNLTLEKLQSKSNTNLEEIKNRAKKDAHELEALKEKYNESNKTIANLKIKIADLNQTLSTKTKELKSCKSNLANDSNLSAKLDTLNQKLAEKEKELKSCKSNLAKDSNLSAKLDTLNQKLAEKDKQLQGLKQKLDQKDKNSTSLTQKLATLTASVASTKDALSKNESKLKSLNDKISAKDKEIKDLKDKLEKERQQVDKVKTLSEIQNLFKISKVKFQTNSATLTYDSKILLDKVADIMKQHPEFHFAIEGHTDSVGNEQHNLKLSQARADSVKNYLVSKGIDESLLTTKGYGSSQPIADNNTKEGRSLNRRVIFKIEN